MFSTAANSYRQLTENAKNQSVLISGESGAGKTETTKKVLTYLAKVAPQQGKSDLKGKRNSSGGGQGELIYLTLFYILDRYICPNIVH